MLELLDERLIRGEISETTYKELKAKYSAKLEEFAEKPAAPKIAVAEKPVTFAAEKPPKKPAPKPPPAKKANVCPHCGAELEPGAKFCMSCGKKVQLEKKANTCPSCGAELESGAKFCTSCGKRIGS